MVVCCMCEKPIRREPATDAQEYPVEVAGPCESCKRLLWRETLAISISRREQHASR